MSWLFSFILQAFFKCLVIFVICLYLRIRPWRPDLEALGICTRLIYLHFTLMWPNADIFSLGSLQVNGYSWFCLSCMGLKFSFLERARGKKLGQSVTSSNGIYVTSITLGPCVTQAQVFWGIHCTTLHSHYSYPLKENLYLWSCSIKAIPSEKRGLLLVFGLFLPIFSFIDKSLSC